VWSQTYDRTLDDVFAVQDDIAHSVVKELRKALLGEADDSDASREAKAEVAQAAAKGRSSNPEVQRLLLLARHVHERRTRVDIESAIKHLEEALLLDPSFATAWAELGRAHNSLFRMGYDEDGVHVEAARQAVTRALELDPKLGEAHSFRCWMHLQDLDIKGAVEAMREAERCEPGQFFVLLAAAAVASVEGRTADSIAIYLKLIEGDPLNTIPYMNLALDYGAVGREEEAAEVLRKALELSPGAAGPRAQYATVLTRLGRIEEALAVVPPDASEPFVLWARAIALAAAGRREESDSELGVLIQKFADYGPTQIASVHAYRGETDLAFSWLDKAKSTKDGGLFEVKGSPEFRPMHRDPRWVELMRWLGLEP
jgi:tetratricopeptide (TPR) repeat protein